VYEFRSEIKNLRWSSTHHRATLFKLPNWGCGLRGAPASCRAPAATGGRRRRGLGQSGGRLRGQGALAPARLRAVACRAPAAVAAVRWDATSGAAAGQRLTARGSLGPSHTGRRVESPAAQTALRRRAAGRRLPGGAAGLGIEGSRGGEGRPPAQSHAAEAAVGVGVGVERRADLAVEVTGSGDGLRRSGQR
jgi:hypothetical protein